MSADMISDILYSLFFGVIIFLYVKEWWRKRAKQKIREIRKLQNEIERNHRTLAVANQQNENQRMRTHINQQAWIRITEIHQAYNKWLSNPGRLPFRPPFYIQSPRIAMVYDEETREYKTTAEYNDAIHAIVKIQCFKFMRIDDYSRLFGQVTHMATYEEIADRNDKIIVSETGAWMRQEEATAMREWHQNFIGGMLWGTHTPREPQPEDNVKLAYVMKDGKQLMAGVDNKTMQGYEMKEDAPTYKLPLVPMAYDSFVRWCRLMDI